MMILLRKTENINFINTFRGYFCVGIAFFALQLVAGHLSKQEDVAGITLHFYDLTLPLISALLVLYRQKALPILGAFFLYALYSYSLSSVFTLTAQLLAALISQTLYFFSTGKRGAVSFGRSQLTTLRIVWLVCCNALLFISIDYWLQSNTASAPITNLFTLQTLINLQWLMNSCLTGIPFCYLLLRSVQNPAWCILYIRQVKTLIKSGPPILYQVLWLVLLLCIM
ncbi:EAL domain-containing protein, partial [Citrobacter freundii]